MKLFRPVVILLTLIITLTLQIFLNSQEKIIDIEREHNNLLDVVPSKWFMNSDVKRLDFKVISSTQSKKVMKTRLDDNIEVF